MRLFEALTEEGGLELAVADHARSVGVNRADPWPISMTNTNVSKSEASHTQSRLWANASPRTSWRTIVSQVLSHIVFVHLSTLYGIVDGHPKTAARTDWRRRIHATLHGSDDFVQVLDGLWSLSSWHSEESLAEFRARQYPDCPGCRHVNDND